MELHRIERHLREGPPDEPAYAGRRFSPPAELSPMTLSRPVLRAAAPSLAGVLVALLVVGLALLGLLRAGQPDQGGPGGIVPAPTATPSPSATPSPTESGCTANELRLTVTSVEGAAGSRILDFTLRNDGPAGCALVVSRATVVDRGASPARTLVAVEPSPAPAVTLQAGSSVDGAARWSNQCGAPPRGPLSLTVDVTPGTTLSGSVPGEIGSSVPPCLGAGGATLELRLNG
jgi:hypothetical protein